MQIRNENEQDWVAVHALNLSAFDSSAEANLVDALRKQASPVISLVADDNDTIVGHIMFSPVSLSDYTNLKLMGLAPMAVAAQHQNKGIGTALVHAGLEQCQQLGFGAIVVVGHANYYPRFGFIPSVQLNIKCEYDVPEDVFMVKELQPGYLKNKSGMIKYHKAFNNV